MSADRSQDQVMVERWGPWFAIVLVALASVSGYLCWHAETSGAQLLWAYVVALNVYNLDAYRKMKIRGKHLSAVAREVQGPSGETTSRSRSHRG